MDHFDFLDRVAKGPKAKKGKTPVPRNNKPQPRQRGFFPRVTNGRKSISIRATCIRWTGSSSDEGNRALFPSVRCRRRLCPIRSSIISSAGASPVRRSNGLTRTGVSGSYSDWVAYLDELKAVPFWPYAPDDVGARLEALAKPFRHKRGQIVGLSNVAPSPDALWWYVGGLAVVGLASGFFAGASYTPIVGTFCRFCLRSSAAPAAFYCATANLSTPEAAARLRWLGRALGVFGLACLVAYGLGNRAAHPLRAAHSPRIDLPLA